MLINWPKKSLKMHQWKPIQKKETVVNSIDFVYWAVLSSSSFSLKLSSASHWIEFDTRKVVQSTLPMQLGVIIYDASPRGNLKRVIKTIYSMRPTNIKAGATD